MSEFRTIDLQRGGKSIALGGIADDDITSRPNGLVRCDMDLIATDKSNDNITNFVQTLESGNAAATDYVIEQDTSGIWFYRKWNSGLAECWGVYSYSVVTADFAVWVTPVYGTTPAPAQPYPFEFVATPLEWASIESSVNAFWLYKESGSHNSYYQTAIYRPVKVNSGSDNLIEIRYYVVGRWK